jgi:hypothetical protein
MAPPDPWGPWSLPGMGSITFKLQLLWILKVIDYKLITAISISNRLHLITFPSCNHDYL